MTDVHEYITRLATQYQMAIEGDDHKDRDCHWQIEERWDYGEFTGYWVRHDGYVYGGCGGLWQSEDGPFPTRAQAVARLERHIRNAIQRAEQ